MSGRSVSKVTKLKATGRAAANRQPKQSRRAASAIPESSKPLADTPVNTIVSKSSPALPTATPLYAFANLPTTDLRLQPAELAIQEMRKRLIAASSSSQSSISSTGVRAPRGRKRKEDRSMPGIHGSQPMENIHRATDGVRQTPENMAPTPKESPSDSTVEMRVLELGQLLAQEDSLAKSSPVLPNTPVVSLLGTSQNGATNGLKQGVQHIQRQMATKPTSVSRAISHSPMSSRPLFSAPSPPMMSHSLSPLTRAATPKALSSSPLVMSMLLPQQPPSHPFVSLPSGSALSQAMQQSPIMTSISKSGLTPAATRQPSPGVMPHSPPPRQGPGRPPKPRPADPVSPVNPTRSPNLPNASYLATLGDLSTGMQPPQLPYMPQQQVPRAKLNQMRNQALASTFSPRPSYLPSQRLDPIREQAIKRAAERAAGLRMAQAQRQPQMQVHMNVQAQRTPQLQARTSPPTASPAETQGQMLSARAQAEDQGQNRLRMGQPQANTQVMRIDGPGMAAGMRQPIGNSQMDTMQPQRQVMNTPVVPAPQSSSPPSAERSSSQPQPVRDQIDSASVQAEVAQDETMNLENDEMDDILREVKAQAEREAERQMAALSRTRPQAQQQAQNLRSTQNQSQKHALSPVAPESSSPSLVMSASLPGLNEVNVRATVAAAAKKVAGSISPVANISSAATALSSPLDCRPYTTTSIPRPRLATTVPVPLMGATGPPAASGTTQNIGSFHVQQHRQRRQQQQLLQQHAQQHQQRLQQAAVHNNQQPFRFTYPAESMAAAVAIAGAHNLRPVVPLPPQAYLLSASQGGGRSGSRGSNIRNGSQARTQEQG